MKSQWKQGEHLSIVGPTGVGKTWLAADLLPIRDYTVVVTTKKKDKTLVRFKNYYKMKKWVSLVSEPRIMLKPIARKLDDSRYIAQKEIHNLLSDAYVTGGWSIYLDDAFFVAKTLGLEQDIQMMYTQARSNAVTLISSLQRPRWVPLEILSQSTHVILFRTNDELDLDRVSQATGMNRKEIREVNKHVAQYSFLYIKNGNTYEYIVKE